MSRVLIGLAILAAGILGHSRAAFAQWTPVGSIPASDLFSLEAKGDTLVAGGDTTAFVSTDGGAHWTRSRRPSPAAVILASVLPRNGLLYAGTLGQGVFVSGDLGATWQAFNQGLVGGFANSQLHVDDLETRGDSLYAATLGAGVYVRSLAGAGTWHPYGEVFEPEQASNVSDLALGGSRLIACAGANGESFSRDPLDAEWTISEFSNGGLLPGVQAYTSLWLGDHWVVGTGKGVFLSADGLEPWTFVNLGAPGVNWITFGSVGSDLFAALDFFTGAAILQSSDGGASWSFVEFQSGVFVYRLAVHGTDLYAARNDGLWVHPTQVASVPHPATVAGPHLAVVGPQPSRDAIRLRFELPEAGEAGIEVFDVMGRRALPGVVNSWSAGAHELDLDAHALAPGVYAARVIAGGQQASVRVVHAR